MEKPSSSSASNSSNRSRKLQCVGRLEIDRPKPVGFLCGSIPVPTDKSFHVLDSALVPTAQTVRAPRYRMIPTETDLNTLPLLSSFPEKVLPIAAAESRIRGDLPWESAAITSHLTRKVEDLAVSGLVEYGDEIDVIAPADILKQIFKMPYSKARLSIAVHRVGQALILNVGPDVEEGEKLIRRHSNQSESADQSLFLNFAMHSVRMEACDCPPTHPVSSENQSNSSFLPGQFDSGEGIFVSSDLPTQRNTSRFCGPSDEIDRDDGFNQQPEYPQIEEENLFWRKKKNKRNKGHDDVKKVSQVKEKPSCVQESENFGRVSSEGFLKVLFWQFHNFRMLLGSDLLIFSNDKYVAVSLHLWDISRKVTALTWLEAWLDNVMASVPELAICYHQDGVVQGYELLKTDDIFLLKGISEDGTPAFNPNVVQQNGLSVLRFLQENCKQDPGAYWLYKSVGEDVIQLFDLSAIPKSHSSNECDSSSSSLPSLVHRGRSDSLLSLGTLLYRTAHRLSLSMSPNNRAKCARFLRQCLDFLDEPDYLVVRACAHEQFARLLLTFDEDLDVSFEALPAESEVTVVDADESPFDFFSGSSTTVVHELLYSPVADDEQNNDTESLQDSGSEVSQQMTLDVNVHARMLIESNETRSEDLESMHSYNEPILAACEMPETNSRVQSAADPISSKLVAIHHVSQAIKSLRWKRQLQSTQPRFDHCSSTQDRLPSLMDFYVCTCGDTDCIEMCDIREWLPTSKLDDKVWKLVLLLGESYLALGQAYKDDGQLHQVLKVVKLACLVYGAMPQLREESRFISSMVCNLRSQEEHDDLTHRIKSLLGNATKLHSSNNDDCLSFENLSSSYLFWYKAWTLVGDVYVESHMIKGKEISIETENKPSRELKMSSEVLKEVERLKRKLGQFSQNCSSCSLVNCSCQSDRASSGSSASSSTRETRSAGYSRKHNKKSYGKNSPCIPFGNPEDDGIHVKRENENTFEGVVRNGNCKEDTDMVTAAADYHRADRTMEVHLVDSQSEITLTGKDSVRNGGIFKFLGGPILGDTDYNLSAALGCYEEAIKALTGHPNGSAELQSVLKKKGWVCNELGRIRLERKELDIAEVAFSNAINAFKEVSDHTNIILINCNLGHGRRALAEEMVSRIENLKKHAFFHEAYKNALETAKLEYRESLRYYGAAKTELNAMSEGAVSVANRLRNEVYTQFANTFLRLGMLLAGEDTNAEIYENGVLEDCIGPGVRNCNTEFRKHEISANDAIREALAIYECLGELRRQELAYACFQLACYQRDCCLKFLEFEGKKLNLSKGESGPLQRVKQYLSLAERNWQKSIDFYKPITHPVMFLTILIERSALLFNLLSYFHSNTMLESALACLLEGRYISERTVSDSLRNDNPEVHAKFWSQLQMILKKMLTYNLPANGNKSSIISQKSASSRSGLVAKLKELYKMSLKSTDFCQLDAMHNLWTSS